MSAVVVFDFAVRHHASRRWTRRIYNVYQLLTAWWRVEIVNEGKDFQMG
jgi:hypothetical protein